MTNSRRQGCSDLGDLLPSFGMGGFGLFSIGALSPLAFTLTGFHIAAVSP